MKAIWQSKVLGRIYMHAETFIVMQRGATNHANFKTSTIFDSMIVQRECEVIILS